MSIQKKSPYKVFISHAGEDMWVAEQISKCVQSVGADTFLDRRDIHAGDDFKARIRREIPKCQELIALFTPWSKGRFWVRHEMGIADAHELRIVCIFYGLTIADFDNDADGRGPLEDVSNIDINNFDSYLSQLRGRIPRTSGDRRINDDDNRDWKVRVDETLEVLIERLEKQQGKIGEIENWQSEYKKILPQVK